MAALVVAYALSPIDLIPDFVPVLGYVDDALLLPALIWLTIRMLPSDVLADCRGGFRIHEWTVYADLTWRPLGGTLAPGADGE